MKFHDRFIACSWRCEKCRQQGTVRVWQRPDELSSTAALRHGRETVAACVFGCRYIAVPLVGKPPSADAVDPHVSSTGKPSPRV